MFVSVSQFGVSLVLPFGSFSVPFLTPCLIVSLGGREKRGKKKERKEKHKPLADLKPVQQVLLVFLDATGREGWASLFSLPMVLRGWQPGLGCNIRSCPAYSPGPP